MKLMIKILRAWSHGFKTKTGGEPWLRRSGEKENLRFPVGSQRRLQCAG